MAPNNFMTKNKFGFCLIMAETPKASKVACTKQPVINPATVAMPYFFPLAILWMSTKILSGPGEMANAAVANTNVNSIS